MKQTVQPLAAFEVFKLNVPLGRHRLVTTPNANTPRTLAHQQAMPVNHHAAAEG
jgi:hypothetical protein